MAEITPELREQIIKSFTDQQRKVYDNLVGNKKRLQDEFKFCRQAYGDVIDVINKKECGQQVRLFLRNVSDYFQRRMTIMERSLEVLCGPDFVKEVKNAKD
jgi:hypothetical protein